MTRRWCGDGGWSESVAFQLSATERQGLGPSLSLSLSWDSRGSNDVASKTIRSRPFECSIPATGTASSDSDSGFIRRCSKARETARARTGTRTRARTKKNLLNLDVPFLRRPAESCRGGALLPSTRAAGVHARVSRPRACQRSPPSGSALVARRRAVPDVKRGRRCRRHSCARAAGTHRQIKPTTTWRPRGRTALWTSFTRTACDSAACG